MKPIYAHLSGALALTFAIAACVPAPEPTPPPDTAVTPPPPPPPPPAPVPAYSNWMDAPRTDGDWSYGAVAGGSVARFGGAASEWRFALMCDPSARRVTLTRYGPAAAANALTIRTETASRTLAAQPSSDRASVSTSLAASDPLLDAMALTQGRFAVEATDLPPLYLPAWGEVSRVIEDCR